MMAHSTLFPFLHSHSNITRYTPISMIFSFKMETFMDKMDQFMLFWEALSLIVIPSILTTQAKMEEFTISK